MTFTLKSARKLLYIGRERNILIFWEEEESLNFLKRERKLLIFGGGRGNGYFSEELFTVVFLRRRIILFFPLRRDW